MYKPDKEIPRGLYIFLEIGKVLLIPIIIVGISSVIQWSIQKESTNSVYVQTAISILQDKETSSELKAWAVKIVDQKSPIPLSDDLSSKLKSGEITFPPTKCDDGTYSFSEGSGTCSHHGGIDK